MKIRNDTVMDQINLQGAFICEDVSEVTTNDLSALKPPSRNYMFFIEKHNSI
jgi:hypothetical protein